tara:strand:- start:7043 stop:7606 length:564 start_codon:yes stop_codon:yes gene_type:complete
VFKMDFFIDNIVKKVIIDIIENKDTLPNDIAVWKSQTRRLFHKHPAHKMWDMMGECLAEASDEQWFEHKYPKEVFEEKFVNPKMQIVKGKRKSVIKINLKNSQRRKLINDNLKITDVVQSYGIKVRGKKAICPFHKDTDPSLSLSNDKNVFNCFGCSAKGDIITFIKNMEELKKRGWEQEKKPKIKH